MATQTQWRGDTTERHRRFIGANREITVDTDKKTVVVHDGNQAGGFPLAREDLSNVEKQTLIEKLALGNLKDFDIKAFIEKEKEKLKTELRQKLKSLFTSGQAWIETIKSAVIEHIDAHYQKYATPLGAVFSYTSNAPPVGFLLLDGQTIGASNSEANHIGDEYKALYTLLWENIDPAYNQITNGKGASANDDWNAGKRISLPDVRGRSIIGNGQGSGLSNRPLGSNGGEENHTLSINEMPAHSHTVNSYVIHDDYPPTYFNATLYAQAGANHPPSTSSAGGNAAHNNMQPFIVLNWIIKY